MTKNKEISYIRQADIVSADKLKKLSVSIIGAGSVGSFTALILAKMGVQNIEVYDEDGIQTHNLPAQFYRKQDIGQFKTEALGNILNDFADVKGKYHIKNYKNQRLNEIVIVCTDNMASRKLVWENFLKQAKTKYFIDARMGAELAKLYLVKDKNSAELYKSTLHSDKQSARLPCTGRTIIYNVTILSGLIARAVKALISENDKFPEELIFNMTRIDKFSLMVR